MMHANIDIYNIITSCINELVLSQLKYMLYPTIDWFFCYVLIDNCMY